MKLALAAKRRFDGANDGLDFFRESRYKRPFNGEY